MCGLIVSSRLRPGDLEQWQSWEAIDRLYSRRYPKKLEEMGEKAIEVIAAFLKEAPAYCSVSWGKDSTVLAYLVAMAAPSTALVSVVCNRSNPDNDSVRTAFLRQFPLRYESVYVELDPNDRGESAAAVAAFFKPVQQKYGDRRIVGIRGDESAARRLQMLQHGACTKNVCRPLIRWTMQDVFAFLHLKDLPIHPVYAMSGAGLFERKQLRVDVLGDAKGNQFGRRQWEEMYYPAELRSFEIPG